MKISMKMLKPILIFLRRKTLFSKSFDGLWDPLAEFLDASSWMSSPLDWIIFIEFLFFFFFCPSTYNACFGRFCGPSTSPMINGDDPRGYKPENFTVPPEWVPLTTNVAVRIHEAKNRGKRDSSDELGTSTKDICSGFNWRILDLLWSEFTYWRTKFRMCTWYAAL